MKEFIIKFRNDTISTEDLRECIEDGLGVEILEINEEEFKNKKEFKKSNPLLIKEWEAYRKTKIKDGLNLAESFFNWLAFIKKIDWKKLNLKKLKGGLK